MVFSDQHQALAFLGSSSYVDSQWYPATNTFSATEILAGIVWAASWIISILTVPPLMGNIYFDSSTTYVAKVCD